jgi:hypothetical protein
MPVIQTPLEHNLMHCAGQLRRDAGRYQSKLWHDKDYPKVQILTIEGLMNGTERVESPSQSNPFAKAQRESKNRNQPELPV